MIRKNNSISILFIGNSFSYYNSLPKLIAYFSQASNRDTILVDGVFRGGGTLEMLWNNDKTLKKLHSKTWDYVVLQDRGRLGGIVKNGIVHIGKPNIFFAYASRFNQEIKKVNAKTILYCPPAFLGDGLPKDAEKLDAIHAMLAQKLDILMIPSITAFTLALKKWPLMGLYEYDGHHPNPLGTYLVACLFYRKLFNKEVSNLPLESYLSRSQRLPKNPKIVKLPKVDAEFLWSVANHIK